MTARAAWVSWAPWAGGAAAGTLAVAAGLALVRIPDPTITNFSQEERGGGGLILADLSAEAPDDALRGELALKDPTPLFLPTARNSGQVDAGMTAERSPGTSFGSFEPKLIYPLAANNLDIPEVVELPRDGLGAIQQTERWLPGAELSRADVAGQRLAPRWGMLRVVSVESGQVVMERVLGEEGGGERLEGPVEALLVVNTDGSWIRPTVMESLPGVAIDSEQVDLWLRKADLEAVLTPGFYRISLVP